MKAFYAKRLETLTVVAILLCLPCSANSGSPGGLDWLQKPRTSIRPPTWRHWFRFHLSHSSQISAFTYSSRNPFCLYVNPSLLTSCQFPSLWRMPLNIPHKAELWATNLLHFCVQMFFSLAFQWFFCWIQQIFLSTYCTGHFSEHWKYCHEQSKQKFLPLWNLHSSKCHK